MCVLWRIFLEEVASGLLIQDEGGVNSVLVAPYVLIRILLKASKTVA